MKKFAFVTFLAIGFASTPALAQEESTFSGPYAGLSVGYDHVVLKEDSTNTSGSKDGVAFGALMGYNADLGDVVVGFEGEIGEASTKETETDFLTAGDEVSLSANLDLSASARIGFKASPSTLIYVKGGYAATKVTLAYDDGVDSFSDSDTLDGFRVGGGIEFATSDKISIRAEYRYTDYGEYTYLGTPTGISASRHQVVVALVGKF